MRNEITVRLSWSDHDPGSAWFKIIFARVCCPHPISPVLDYYFLYGSTSSMASKRFTFRSFRDKGKYERLFRLKWKQGRWANGSKLERPLTCQSHVGDSLDGAPRETSVITAGDDKTDLGKAIQCMGADRVIDHARRVWTGVNTLLPPGRRFDKSSDGDAYFKIQMAAGGLCSVVLESQTADARLIIGDWKPSCSNIII